MNNLKITILGSGGCINSGLPYNSFIVNDNFLIEVPPDIMLSLKTLDLDINLIDTIFISHLHGDHTFGLPFFIINRWIKSEQKQIATPLTILGPNGIEPYVKKITEDAFTTANPCYKWLEQNISYGTIRRDVTMTLKNLKFSC
ncbi:MAG: MBL fold metallo-hydrolase, partial [Desulfobacterales bacterium]